MPKTLLSPVEQPLLLSLAFSICLIFYIAAINRFAIELEEQLAPYL